MDLIKSQIKLIFHAKIQYFQYLLYLIIHYIQVYMYKYICILVLRILKHFTSTAFDPVNNSLKSHLTGFWTYKYLK